MNRNMKTIYIFVLLSFLCTNICFAQDKLFEKYADSDSVSSVYISKTMFRMMPDVQTIGLNLMNLKGKIESLQILSTESVRKKEQIKKEFTQLARNQYEELMRIKENGTRATFYVHKKGDIVTDLLMIADTDDGLYIIQLLGKFTLQDIQSITDKKADK